MPEGCSCVLSDTNKKLVQEQLQSRQSVCVCMCVDMSFPPHPTHTTCGFSDGPNRTAVLLCMGQEETKHQVISVLPSKANFWKPVLCCGLIHSALPLARVGAVLWLGEGILEFPSIHVRCWLFFYHRPETFFESAFQPWTIRYH